MTLEFRNQPGVTQCPSLNKASFLLLSQRCLFISLVWTLDKKFKFLVYRVSTNQRFLYRWVNRKFVVINLSNILFHQVWITDGPRFVSAIHQYPCLIGCAYLCCLWWVFKGHYGFKMARIRTSFVLFWMLTKSTPLQKLKFLNSWTVCTWPIDGTNVRGKLFKAYFGSFYWQS